MNALIEGLKALRLHGMAGCAQDLLASRTPPNLTTVLKQLIEACLSGCHPLPLYVGELHICTTP